MGIGPDRVGKLEGRHKTGRRTASQTDSQSNRWAEKQGLGQAGHTNWKEDRKQTDRQTDRRAFRQMDRKARLGTTNYLGAVNCEARTVNNPEKTDPSEKEGTNNLKK